jgi:predicted ribosome quality control (RQC) complex YloA/Tae2 family protein
MIQYYLDLENQVKVLQDSRLAGGQIQKIYSTAFYISMAIRVPGKTWYLYLGRGGGHEGIWLHDAPPPSSLRRRDNFLEYFRRHLSSCSFLNVELDKSDRIIKLNYQKYGQVVSLGLFWKARKLYFSHYFQDPAETPFKLLLSWHGKAAVLPQPMDDFFSYFDEVGRRSDMRHDFQSPQIPKMNELLQQELKAAAAKGLSTNPGFLQRKKTNIEEDLRRAQQWQRLQTLLDGETTLSGYELQVGDHKIKFEGELNPFERRNLVFQKIKKLKRGEAILQSRLEQVSEQLEGRKQVVEAVSQLPIIKPVWGKSEGPVLAVTKKAENDFRVFHQDKIQFGVGLNAHGNDQLRNKWAHKEDFWFHLEGIKSAHVIVKLPSGKLLDSELTSTAASILAYFSHFNQDWIPVIYTQVKNLKGVTGAPGMVIFKKEKHMSCPKLDISQLMKE